MPKDGTKTKTAIMDSAEDLILVQGFAGTRVEDVINDAGVTKGAFFHHFDTKQDLAHALIDRFVERDEFQLNDKMDRAERLQKDPLQQMLVFLALMREDAEQLTHPTPGCLLGSYVYEAGLFDDAILKTMNDSMLVWRDTLEAKFKEISNLYTPRAGVDIRMLADTLTVIFEGAYVIAKTVKEPGVVAGQIDLFITFVELLFSERI